MAARLRERRAAYQAGPPGPLYCDSSALLKLYMPEPGSDDLNRMAEGRDDVVVSDLALTEVISALARRLREGGITPESAARMHRALVGALDDGVYRWVDLTRAVHRRAEHFLLALTATPLRAADALHLALATATRAASMASFDGRLRAAAHGAGLAVYPP